MTVALLLGESSSDLSRFGSCSSSMMIGSYQVPLMVLGLEVLLVEVSWGMRDEIV